MKKLISLLLAIFASACIFAQSQSQKMSVEFGGKSYELNLASTKTAETFAKSVGGKSLSMTKYGGFEFYSYTALDYGKSDATTSVYKAGRVYYNLNFQAVSVAYDDHSIGSAKAIEIGEFADKSACDALKNLSNESVFSFKKSESAAASAQVIVRWHIQSGFIAIPGSSNPKHIAENYDVWDFSLTDEEMAEIAKLNTGKRYENW